MSTFAAFASTEALSNLMIGSDRRFPGYADESSKLDAAVHRKYIYGVHVSDYMKELEEEDPEAFAAQFSRLLSSLSLSMYSPSLAEYVKNGVKAGDVETIYKKAFAAIRKDPVHVSSAKKEVAHKRFGRKKFNLAQRQNRVAQKKATYLAKLAAGDEE